MQTIPYTFYRYSITNKHSKKVISPIILWNLLCENTGKEVPYRKKDPRPIDFDTSWVEPDEFSLELDSSYSIYTCQIARHLTTRKAKQYDKQNDRLFHTRVSTSEYATSRAIFIPQIAIVAFADQTGEGAINASSASSRFATIVRYDKKYDCDIELAATTSDLESALRNWSLTDFSFTARPFNPTIRTPGDKLHPLLKEDNAKIVGHARPNKNSALTVSEDGFISEITGLAQHGYAEYGASGKTPSGFLARIAKVTQRHHADTERQIKIFIPIETNLEAHILNVARTAIETYERYR